MNAISRHTSNSFYATLNTAVSDLSGLLSADMVIVWFVTLHLNVPYSLHPFWDAQPIARNLGQTFFGEYVLYLYYNGPSCIVN